jgi:broad specificity phosphatase PhoE
MTKPSGYTIHLLRVGETTWDADLRLIGQTDLPMTESGSNQVIDAIRQFEPQCPISVIYSSDEESAQWSAKHLNQSPDTKIKTVDSLVNVGLGLWEGVLHSDLEVRCPSAYSQWKETPERITPPEGESFNDAQDRLVKSIKKVLLKTKGEHPTVAIVLRPWAWAIVRCWLLQQSITDIWPQLSQPVKVETFEIMKSDLDAFQEHTKASA